MAGSEVSAMLALLVRTPSGSEYLALGMAQLIGHKKCNRRLAVKIFWTEYCEEVARLENSPTFGRCSAGCSRMRGEGGVEETARPRA